MDERQHIPPLLSRSPETAPARVRRPLPILNLVLFAVTFCTTTMAGALQAGADPFRHPAHLTIGIPFAATLMTILLVHELGHYVLSRVHNVRATLPYFLPAPPFFIGTFGAFIRMKSPPASRRALFDVGAAGPWAGLFVAVPAVVMGLRLSTVYPGPLPEGGLLLGDSLLFKLLTQIALGHSSDDVTIVLHPVALAGWFGLFVTFLNLVPVGQLDGGHVAYALFGRHHRWIARGFLAGMMLLCLQGWPGWLVWAALLMILGLDHPPTRDVDTPLDPRRRMLGWMTVGVFVLTFIPVPIQFAEPPTIELTPAVFQALPGP